MQNIKRNLLTSQNQNIRFHQSPICNSVSYLMLLATYSNFNYSLRDYIYFSKLNNSTQLVLPGPKK